MWHKRAFIAAQVVVTLLTAPAGHAAPLYFDAEGGMKPWLGSHWAADPAGPYNQPWVNGSGAVLTGTAGTATVGSPIAPSSVAIGAGYTVSLASSSSFNLLGSSSPITVESGGVLSADNASNNAHNLGLVTLNGGSLSSNAVGSQYGNFILNSGVTAGGTAMSTVDARSVSLRNIGEIFNVADATAGTDLLIQSNIVNHPGFDAVLTKTGAGTLELTGANSYTGGTNVDQGTLHLVGTNSGTGTVRGTVTVNPGTVLQLDGGYALGWGNDTRVHTLNIDGGFVENVANAGEAWGIAINLTGGTLQSNGGVASTSTPSHFSLGGATGGTGSVVNTLVSADTSVIAGRINLRENNPGNRLVFNVADGAAAVDLLVSAAITQQAGGYGITKNGDGSMRLTAANTYTGATTVAAGTLTLSDGGRLGGGTYNAPITIGDGAVLNFNMTNSQNLGGALTGTGTLAQNTAADYLYMTGDHSAFEGTFHNLAGNMFLASSAANSPAGARARVDGGLLQVAPNGSGDGTWRIGALSGTGGAVQPNRNLAGRAITLEVGGLNTDTSYAGALRNNSNGTPSVLALAKVGTGTLTLAATNTYTGGTTVEGGVLEMAATRALGSGPIAINGGTVRLATNAYNALGTPSPAIMIGPGATLTADQGDTNAHNLGPLTLNGGTLTSLNGPAGPANDGNYGNFILNSGLTAGGNAVSTISSTTLSWKVGGGTLTVAEGSQLDVSSRIHDYPGSSEPLAKQGLGTLTLTGPNTYTGGTTVDAGTLLANNATGSGTGSGAVTVNSGAVLGGTGRIGGNVSIGAGGSLAPGESPGTLQLGGNLTFDPNAFFDIDIDAVDLADMVQMEGGTLWPNDAAIRVDLGFSPALGDSWTILQGEGIRDGMFKEEVLVPNGSERLGWMQFEVSYGSSVILTVVPEPGTGLLLLAALACGMLVRRRRTFMIYDL